MVLQIHAFDLLILKQVRELRQQLSHAGVPSDELPTDAYYFSGEIISKLEELLEDIDDEDVVLEPFKKWVIFRSLQEMWSYAIASPKAIHDLHSGPQMNVEDKFNAYRTTDRADPKISGAYEESQRKSFLTQLTKVNRGTPLNDPNVLQCCLEVALHVGRIKDNAQSSEEKVVTDLFGQDAHLVGIQSIEDDADFTLIVDTIMRSMPNDVLGSLNSSFLYNVVSAWQKLFSDSQSDMFDVIYDRLSSIEDKFISSKSSESQLDYKHEADEFVLNTLREWKTEMRMQELWSLSRDPTPIRISAALRSLEVLDNEMIFKPGDYFKLKPHARKKNTIEPELSIVRSDGTIISDSGQIEVGEPVKLVCRNLKPTKKYELLIVPNKGTEKTLRQDLVPNNDGFLTNETTIAIEGDLSIHLRSEKNEKITGPSLRVTPVSTSSSTAISASIGDYKFWSVAEDMTGGLGWKYLLYFSLLLEPRVADLFIFIIENSRPEKKEKLHLDKIIPYAMYPEIIEPISQGYLGGVSTLDYDKITRNNLSIGGRVRKTGGLNNALSELGEELV